jgi:uncharacterized protein (TIRG00374 family)
MVGLSILLAGLFIYLAIRKLDWDHFAATIRSADYQYLPLLFLWGSLTNWIRANRWRVLLNVEKHVPLKNVFWANMAGYLGNNILPARTGELVRAFYLSKENNIAAPFVLATGLVERLVDLIALILLAILSLQNTGILPEVFRPALNLISSIAATGFLAILVAPYFGRRLVNRIAVPQGPGVSAKSKILNLLIKVIYGIESLHHPKRAASFLLFTGLIWLMDGIGAMILALSLHLQITLAQSLLLLASLGLSSAIPSTPGYVGVYQFVAVIVLQPFGISNADALAFILLLQAVGLLVVFVWGGIAALRATQFSQQQIS